MIKPFEAGRNKIDRAKRHLLELQAEIDGYFQRGGAYVTFEIAEEYAVMSETGCFVYRESEPVPIVWSAIIGDVLHNLRSSLDLMACDVHRITGGRSEDIDKVHYPFCKREVDFQRTIKDRRLGHVGKEFLDVFTKTAPYKGGNDGLRAIHDLNILDKHQALVPTIAVVSMDWPVKVTEGSRQFVTGVKKDGQRLIMFPRHLCPLSIGTKITVDFSIVFGDIDIFKHRDIIKQFNECVASVEFILSLFQTATYKSKITK